MAEKSGARKNSPRKSGSRKASGKVRGRPRGKAPAGPMSGENGAGADGPEPVVIRKYANRRLYNTATASFVTLDDLRRMVTDEEPFIVVDAKTDRDITSSLLAQIIADQETRGESMLPNDVLRQIISFYEKGMTESVSTYLQKSMDAFTDNWQQAEQLGEIGRRNMELFQQSVATMLGQGGRPASPSSSSSAGEPEEKDVAAEVNDLQEQLRTIQEKLAALGGKTGDDT